jgi:homoserine O-acetyltransferase/O-succinyltransferase
MISNNYYSQDVHGPYEMHDIGNLELEEGGTIRGCTLAYATFGSLNGAGDNAILVPTWYSGTHKIIEQVYIGKGRALDPDRYFIIVVNQIGNGLSTSPHNSPAPAGMGNFPHVRIGDDVRAQHALVTDKFGLASKRPAPDRTRLYRGGNLHRVVREYDDGDWRRYAHRNHSLF